ncbi:hypothetical protein ACMGT0_20580 [Pseudomonas sp. RHF3.3-3]|uniref:hypothetical protein n=1 Tax=Pseudomonas sp. RHF3.3-3 TaxID=3396624 RepID=UPI003A84191C
MKMGTAYYGALRNSGMPHRSATALVNALEKDMTSVLASKADLTEARNELKADIADVRHELMAVRSEFKLDITRLEANMATFRSEIRADMSEIRHTLEVNGERQSKELAKQENKLTLRLGAMLVGCVSLLFAALKYL